MYDFLHAFYGRACAGFKDSDGRPIVVARQVA